MRTPEKRPASSPPSKAELPGAWESHEHVTVEGQLQAQRLIETVGSPELAKHAIDRAQEIQSAPATSDDELARQLGYGSFLELFEASSPTDTSNGRHWCVTPTSYGKWVAWDRKNRHVSHEFDSRDAAMEFVKDLPDLH